MRRRASREQSGERSYFRLILYLDIEQRDRGRRNLHDVHDLEQHSHMIKRGAKTDGRARQGGAPRDLLRREGAGADRHGCGAELRQLQRAGERAAVWRMPAGRHGEKRAASGEWCTKSGEWCDECGEQYDECGQQYDTSRREKADQPLPPSRSRREREREQTCRPDQSRLANKRGPAI